MATLKSARWRHRLVYSLLFSQWRFPSDVDLFDKHWCCVGGTIFTLRNNIEKSHTHIWYHSTTQDYKYILTLH